ncbi:MAG TPA: type VI secretion system contractile sheath protein TssC [Bacteroidales bacterium]|nr:type VI secretion system contractile sheath protein TssC [Bacteroidales bacterium]
MEEQKDLRPQETSQFKERVAKEMESLPASEVLKSTLDTIQTTVGVEGFDFLANLIDGIENMNPEKKARKKIFLTETSRKQDRKDLKNRLNLWVEILSADKDHYGMVESCEKAFEEAKKGYEDNLATAVNEVKDLEQAYRAVYLFFRNTEESKTNYISIMNASLQQLTDPNTAKFAETIESELNSKYDRLDLCENYSLLVLPGFLGSKQNIAEWARRANKYKVMLVTDYRGDMFEEAGDLLDMVENDKLSGGEDYLANVILTCNWLVGRDKHVEISEEEPLFVPPSAVLAGRLYGTSIAQVVAGKKFGELLGVQGTMIPLLKSELSKLREMGVVPMVDEWGKIMAFSDKTLYDGANQKFQTYSIVRVYDYLSKVLVDFCNRRAFENFDDKTKREFKIQITKYLEGKKWDDKIIENYEIIDLRKVDDKVYLDISLTPLYPAVSFKINLEAEKEGDRFNFKAN